jgi:hypothetical protein
MSTSYWLDRSKSEGRKSYDAVIVGGGISGLSTAYWLNKEDPTLKVAIIEKSRLAFGASGRNAGFITCGSVEHFNRMINKHGLDQATEIWRFAQTNLKMLKEEIITHLKFRIVKLNQRRRAYEDKINSDKANENKPKLKIKMGLCGNLPSQLPSFAQFLASERPEEDVAFGEFELRKGMGRVVDEFSVTTDALITSLLAITGEKPEGKVTVTTYCEDGSVLVNGELVVEAVEI